MMPSQSSGPQSNAAERVLAELDHVPALPALVVSIVQGAGASINYKTLLELAQQDPSLDAAAVGRGGADLVQSLGTQIASQVLVTRSMMSLFGHDDADDQFREALDALWKHSLATACAASLIVGRAGVDLEPQTAFFLGLFHDVGKAAMCTAFPKSYSRIRRDAGVSLVSSCELERAVFGTDHAVVGRRLASRWRLPQKFADCMWLHHSPPDALPPSVAILRHVQSIALANVLVREHGYASIPGSTSEVSSTLICRALGLSPEDVEAIATQLPDEIAAREPWLGLGHGLAAGMNPRELRRRVADMSTANTALRKEHNRTRRGARLTSIINLFTQQIDLNTSTAELCRITAATLKSYFRASGIVVFFDRPSIGALNVGLAEAQREDFEIIEAPPEIDFESFARIASSPSALLGPVPDSCLCLVRRYHDWLASDDICFLPIIQENRAIGGVLISAPGTVIAELVEHVAQLHSLSQAMARAAGLVRAQADALALSDELASTHRRIADARNSLLHEQSLETLVTTAGGIAHELNNPLALISGRAQLLLSEASDARVRDSLSQIVRQAQAAGEIISDLMEFAQAPKTSPRIIDLADLLDSLRTELVSRGLLTPVQISVEVPSHTPKVFFDPDLLRSIFRELLGNALEATDSVTRCLTIKVRFDLSEEKVVVTVADNGRGMKPEVLDRAMDPFFSHRPAGRGRGMGLTRVSRWLNSGRGTIQIRSAPQRGTQVELLLPTRS
jgi:putative nucleotidyltransferase with HDIG domain